MDIAKLAKELGLSKDDREKILKFAIALNQQEAKPEFVPTKAAIAELGGISGDMLVNRVESGEFQYAVHYINAIDSIKGERGYYLWNTEAIKELWKIPPEKRRSRQPSKSNRILKIA